MAEPKPCPRKENPACATCPHVVRIDAPDAKGKFTRVVGCLAGNYPRCEK